MFFAVQGDAKLRKVLDLRVRYESATYGVKGVKILQRFKNLIILIIKIYHNFRNKELHWLIKNE